MMAWVSEAKSCSSGATPRGADAQRSTNAGFSRPKNRSGSIAGSSATVASQESLTGVLRRSRVARVRARFFRMPDDPGLQARAELKSAQATQHMQPRLLRDVFGRGRVGYIAQEQPHQHGVVLVYEPGEGAVVTLLQGRDHLVFARIHLECQRRAIIGGAGRRLYARVTNETKTT